MATSYHVFGPCVPQVGTGTLNAMEVLGVTLDGGNVQLDHKEIPVHSDAGGPQAEVEIQQVGSIALIDFDLTSWDEAILTKLLLATEAASTLGQAGAPGALLGTGGFLKGLYLPSSVDSPWYFPFAKLMPNSGKFGTEHTRRRLRFKAIRFVPGSVATVAAVPLYTRAAPS